LYRHTQIMYSIVLFLFSVNYLDIVIRLQPKLKSMKKSILFFFLLLLQFQILAQWQDLSIMSGSQIEALDFLDDNKGYILNGNKVYKTTDGALTWNLIFEPNTVTLLQEVYIIEEDIVIIAGKDFTIDHSFMYRTENGGQDWNYINISSNSILSSVHFPTPDIGYCVSLNGEVFKSIDAGLTWEEQDQEVSNNLKSVYFINEVEGIAVGGSPFSSTIIRTVDGGSNWYTVDSPAFEYLQSVFFSSDDIGYIVGWEGQILKTEDGGNSWDLQTSVNMEGNLDVFFTDDDTGYVVGGTQPQSLIQKTTNGGELWEDISPNIGGGLIALDFPSANTGYVVGARVDSMATLLKTETGGITSTENDFHSSDINAYPNPFQNHLNIQSKGSNINLIRVFDFQGRIIKEVEYSQQNISIDSHDLSPNNYFLEIHTDSETVIRKVVKL